MIKSSDYDMINLKYDCQPWEAIQTKYKSKAKLKFVVQKSC